MMMIKQPVDILPLFPVLNTKLVTLLKGLAPEDWLKQTVAKQWVVKDVAAHLLDGNFRQIAIKRDGWTIAPASPIQSYRDLVDYLNQLNADWVKAAKRLSPQTLIRLLEQTNEEVYRIFRDLDPLAPSVFPVSWAGEHESKNWFDTAREYTERWLHQQQIREALGNRDILTKELYYPFLHISLQALPYTLRFEEVNENTRLKVTVTGEGGGEWLFKMNNKHWTMESIKEKDPLSAETIIEGDVAWKLFSKSLRKEDIKGQFEIKGDARLGEKVLDMIAVMA